MPLAGPLRAWIAKCKAYAAQHGCSYKEAMSALGGKSKKSHRRKSHRGGGDGVAAHAESFESLESAAPMAGASGDKTPSAGSSDSHDAAAPAAQTGGGIASSFEVGAMTGMSGVRRRRRARGSNSRRGSKRRGSRRNSRRRQSKRGGGLSYSEF